MKSKFALDLYAACECFTYDGIICLKWNIIINNIRHIYIFVCYMGCFMSPLIIYISECSFGNQIYEQFANTAPIAIILQLLQLIFGYDLGCRPL